MSCPCCLQTPCVALCRMPNQITVEYIAGSFISAANWIPTTAEKDEMEAALNGTYVLDYFTYYPTGIFTLPACARYQLVLPSPFTTNLDIYWFCNTDVSGNAVRLDSYFCGTGPLVGGIEHFRTNPIATFTSTLPTITDYCDGDSFSASIAATALFSPDTVCGVQPGAFQRTASFNVTLDVSI